MKLSLFSVLLSLIVTAGLFADQDAPLKVVHQTAFSVIGITIRTNNAKEASSDGVIGKQWQKFFQEGVPEKIPGRVDNNFYALYSDYANGHSGEYSVTIGSRVADGTPVPAGLVLKTVPAGNYAVVTSEKGPVAKVVVAAWQRVWEMEDKHEFASPRAYKTDFELYDQRGADPQNSQVDLYIGLK
jgi:predicted transcriptional regulator YdeE